MLGSEELKTEPRAGLVRSGEAERYEGRAAALSPPIFMKREGKIRALLLVSKDRVCLILLVDLGAL